MVEIVLGNNYSKLIGELPPYAIERVRGGLSFEKKGCEHIESFQKEEWDGRIYLFSLGESFLTGLLGPLCSILDDCKVEYSVLDRRQVAFENLKELVFSKPTWHEERKYQQFTVQRAIDKTRGILNIGTGGGKTVIVGEIIGRLRVKPFIFYVLTRDLLYQAIDVLSECLNVPIGQVGDGTINVQDITVCTKDSAVYALNKNNRSFDIRNYRFDSCDVWNEKEIFGDSDSDRIVDMVKSCRGLFFDEVHHASCRTVQDIILASPNAYWRYGGTATYMREDGEEIVIQGLFGKRIVDISLSYLIKNKWLVPASVFFVPITINNMLYKSYPQIYKHCVIDNDSLSKQIADLAKYLASMGKNNLILVSKIAHGKNIKKFLPEATFLTGKDSGKKRKKTIDSMRAGKLKILIATTLADEGLDIKNLDVIHMAGAGASITRVPQRIGRVVRKSPGKKYGMAIYYHYCTEHLYQHGLKVKRLMKDEPELEIIQAGDMEDLKAKILNCMQTKESLFSVVG
jgi:superfamily II DNA or RNA helicase